MAFLRKVLPFVWVGVAFSLLNLAWVWNSRQTHYPRRERAVSLAPPVGTALRIPAFYASSGSIIKGEQALICYAAENARSVQLDPPVERVTPADFARCFGVTPSRTTRYTLTAEGFDGARTAESFTIKVSPAPPTILFVEISALEIRRGTPWTFCYGVKHATHVKLEPLGMTLLPSEKSCRRFFPVRTTDFTLVAADELGRSDRERFRLTVQ